MFSSSSVLHFILLMIWLFITKLHIRASEHRINLSSHLLQLYESRKSNRGRSQEQSGSDSLSTFSILAALRNQKAEVVNTINDGDSSQRKVKSFALKACSLLPFAFIWRLMVREVPSSKFSWNRCLDTCCLKMDESRIFCYFLFLLFFLVTR